MSDPITYNPAPTPQAPQPAEESKVKKAGKTFVGRLLVYGIVLVVVLVGGYLYKVFTNDAELAKVGDCITENADANNMKTVDCTDATAAYKVVAVVDGTAGQAQAEDATHPCAKFEAADTSLWIGKVNKTTNQPSASTMGKILCLAPTTK
jgi:hypothetical protein